MGRKKAWQLDATRLLGHLRESNKNLLVGRMEGLRPFMPILTMVKTRMPRRQSAGLLASGTLRRAIFSSKHILNYATGVLVFFNGTTNDDGVGFVWHRIASFSARCFLASVQMFSKPQLRGE